ncbi:MAG: hypothetical protein AAFX85_12080 [Pseudomonadota bacterium]
MTVLRFHRFPQALLKGIALASFALGAQGAEPQVPQSTTVLAFGGANTLFVADSVGGRIYAYELGGLMNASDSVDSAPFNLEQFGTALADHLKVRTRDLRFNDLAVHPVTKDAFVSLSISVADAAPSPAIVRVSADGAIHQLPLQKLPSTSMPLEQLADDGVTFWRAIPASTFAVTDLDFADGVLYVSGLSTGEFASTLRQIPYPFSAQGMSTSSVEIFHTAHGQQETRAPIRAMTVVNLDGKPTVVAAYTCTPLVTFDVASLEDGKHVVGKTVGELGYGNTPLEVVSFTAYNAEREAERFVLVINREMDADLIPLPALEAAVDAPGLTEVVQIGSSNGVSSMPLPLGGTLQAADQDPQYLLTLRRDLDSGDMELVSFRKGAYMRVSTFVSEYNFPDYKYDDSQDGARMFQNLLKVDEGFPEAVK